ncbi:hypothetical protein V8G54_001387 [Vigna mungo]|uniref:Uncharacterized protein n=1 Tax=Vigna mungo TaxID=3915 RepID=A0AAQ3P788_VIGMU
MRMRESKTLTGRMEGNSDGGRFREDQSKHSIRFSTQSMLRFPSSGHHIGKHSSGGGVGSDVCGLGGDCGCGVSSKLGTMPFAESGDGAAPAESACRVMVDERSCRDFKPRLGLYIHLIFVLKKIIL